MHLDTQQLMNLAINSTGIIITLTVGFLCYFMLKKWLYSLLQKKHISKTLCVVLKNMLKWILIISVVIIALQHLGIKVTNIVAGLLTIAGMVAIGFIAVWSVLSNILCSFLLITFRAFNIGDEIEIVEPVGGSGLKGRVVGFNIMFTSLAEITEEGESKILTQVPNNIFFQKSLRRKIGQKTEGLGYHLLNKPIALKKEKIAK